MIIHFSSLLVNHFLSSPSFYLFFCCCQFNRLKEEIKLKKINFQHTKRKKKRRRNSSRRKKTLANVLNRAIFLCKPFGRVVIYKQTNTKCKQIFGVYVIPLFCGFCYLRHARLIWNVRVYSRVCVCMFVCVPVQCTKIIWKLWALDLNTNEQIIDFIEKCQRDG